MTALHHLIAPVINHLHIYHVLNFYNIDLPEPSTLHTLSLATTDHGQTLIIPRRPRLFSPLHVSCPQICHSRSLRHPSNSFSFGADPGSTTIGSGFLLHFHSQPFFQLSFRNSILAHQPCHSLLYPCNLEECGVDRASPAMVVVMVVHVSTDDQSTLSRGIFTRGIIWRCEVYQSNHIQLPVPSSHALLFLSRTPSREHLLTRLISVSILH